MIRNYNIKYLNGEKVLVLYIDYLNEFGLDFRNKHKNSNMKKEIKKYIKKNKIRFDGEKIALSIGGIILAILLVIENPKVADSFDLVYVKDSILPNNEIVEVLNKESINDNQDIEIVKDVNEEPVIISNDNATVTKTKSNNQSVKVKKEETKIEVVEEINKESVEEKETFKEESKQETSVTIYRTNGKVLTLELEEYLIGVVGAEMPASFNIEALKAQAIISRTYALKSLKTGRKLTDSVSTQSYKDNEELKKQWGNDYGKYYQKIKEAVEATKNMAIYYNGDYIDAVFHSTSNGKTEDSKYVWGSDIPYLKSVDSSWDKDTSSYLRNISLDLVNVLNILGVDSSDFSILSRDESGRVLEVSVDGKSFSGVEFRNLLGLRSSDFDIEINGNNVSITTRGYGHGVGLSQYGANEMAKNGYNYEQIIRHYYTGVYMK